MSLNFADLSRVPTESVQALRCLEGAVGSIGASGFSSGALFLVAFCPVKYNSRMASVQASIGNTPSGD